MDALIGKKVKSDIVNHYGITIVPAQTIINHEVVRLLVNHQIEKQSISICDETPDKVRTSQLMRQTVSRSKELFESITSSKKIPVMELRKEVLPVIHEITNHPNVFEMIDIIKAKDEYTYQHNIGVGILSTLIGKWMNLSGTELTILSLAATLHDVGKVNVPTEILNKPGKLTKEEYEIMKKHTVFGYELLKEAIGLHPKVARVALQHHEREDGGGYPYGIKKDQIDLMSSIVAVADVFHALSSERPYHSQLPFHEVMQQMERGKFGELNPQIVSLFMENMIKRTLGKQVVLTDGRLGEVVLLNPHRMEAPLIKIENDFVDLSHAEGLRIKEIVV